MARAARDVLDRHLLAGQRSLPGPPVRGYEPRFQRVGVNVLLIALVLVVAGCMLGQGLAIHQLLGDKVNFWLDHQGYEYVDLGRMWQFLLFFGLLLWLVLIPNPPKGWELEVC